MNDFEENARARKVAAMVEYFDRRLREYGQDPISDAATIVLMLRERTGASEWNSHALLAGQRKPSPTTVAMVIAVYEARARQNQDAAGAHPSAPVLPFKRLGGVH